MRRASLLLGTTGIIFILVGTAAWKGSAQTAAPLYFKGTVLGQSLPGLTANQQADFDLGVQKFGAVETPADGLGPTYNGTACGECHKGGALGGAGLDLTIAKETRIGGIVNGSYSDLENLGGPVLQARSLREFDPTCPIPGEIVPRGTPYVSGRITTPIFGGGLIEGIPDSTIIAETHVPDPDGVHGVANMVLNPETNQLEVGRFGWKAQHSTLHVFAGDAYLNEMGVPSPTFPTKNLPQGQPIPFGWDTGGSLSDGDQDVTAFTNFMRYLAPPPRQIILQPAQLGQQVFTNIRCAACHVPKLMTGPNQVAALSNQPVPLFSDLLVHQMGPGLADGIRQGTAQGDQFRTAPLWGLSHRLFFLHDGRATNFNDAIMAHGGEATPAVRRYQGLNPQDRNNLMAFLRSL